MCVSVLIPFYNTKISHFKECLDSIKNQTFNNLIEIIIVNDGSDIENTNQVTKYIKKLNTSINSKNSFRREFKIFNLDKNYGLPYALNKGLELCNFNLIARMDSDDIMKLDRIQKQYDFMIQNKNCVVLGGQCEILNDVSKKITFVTKHKCVINIDDLKKIISNTCWFINHPTVMYKKDVINKCGNYNTSLVGHAEDAYLWINVLKNGYTLHNLKDLVLTYRDCSSSLSNNFKTNVAEDIKKWVIDLHCNKYPQFYYICNQPNCNLKFERKCDLKRHKKKVHKLN